MAASTTNPRPRPTPILFSLLIITTILSGLSQSFAPYPPIIAIHALAPKNHDPTKDILHRLTNTARNARHRRPSSSNWEDEFSSSRNNAEITEYLPPWRDHQGEDRKPRQNQNRQQQPQQQLPPSGGEEIVSGSSYKSPFQTASTQDFKLPFQGGGEMGGGGGKQQQVFSGSQASAQKSQPFQPFLPISSTPQTNSNPPQDAFIASSTQTQMIPRGGANSASTLLHSIQFPLLRDPIGISPDFPLLLTRITVTILSTLSTWYLHLHNGYSPVLASSATTLLISMCLDRRLGQAAFCGTFAGMSGSHLVPNFGAAMLLGVLTSISFEILIHMKNFCLGVGGRLGATAFLATSILAKYGKVGVVGRRMRRAAWKSGTAAGGGIGPFSSVLGVMVIYHMLGSVATIYLRESSDDSAAADPVRASSVIGLLGALFLKDPVASLAMYGGSFVGMSLPSRLMYGNAPGRAKGGTQTAMKLLLSFGGAGALAGLVHGMTMHWGYWSGGWGGKAGLCAFAGCWIYRGLGNAYEFVTMRK